MTEEERSRILVCLNTVTRAMIDTRVEGTLSLTSEALDPIAYELEGVVEDLISLLGGRDAVEPEETWQGTVPLKWRFKVTP